MVGLKITLGILRPITLLAVVLLGLAPSSAIASSDCADSISFVGENKFDVVIVGGGPAGLSLAKSLIDSGVGPEKIRVLEKGDDVGDSWSHMPNSLCLQGCGFEIGLPGSGEVTGSGRLSTWGRVTAVQFASHLRAYRDHFSIPVNLGAHVDEIMALPNGFVTKTKNGERFFSKFLVNATGYYSNPKKSRNFVGGLHAHDYRSPEQVFDLIDAVPSNKARRAGSGNPSVLIVGDRVSAGQIMVDLVDSGLRIDVSMSMKLDPLKMKFDRDPRGNIFFYAETFITEVFLRSGLARLLPNFVSGNMEAGRAKSILLKEKKVRVLPPAIWAQDGNVRFSDGQSEEFDLVIYATGYAPSLDHFTNMTPLAEVHGVPKLKDMQSVQYPGLYFLGLRGERTALSQYLRGIRDDSVHLAHKLSRELLTSAGN